MKKYHKWTEEEKQYLAEIVSGKSHTQIIEAMKEKFDIEFSRHQIRDTLRRNGLKTGTDGRFKKGQVSLTKGMKGFKGANSTSFKKGHIPHNTKEIGSERINKRGYVEVKTEIGGRWKLKHRIKYEEYHNIELKNSDSVIFADGDKRNFSKENLIKLNKRLLLIANQYGLIKDNTKLTETGIIIAKLILRLQDIEKGQNGK